MPLLLMLWCNVVKRNWIIILMQTVYFCYTAMGFVRGYKTKKR